MPSKNKQYNLVQSDDLDTRIPLMPEEAFQHGIPFNCKFIGSMDIPRPTSRVEIVAAMRRVRVEFKSKGVKKKKVTVTIGVDGIKTTLRKKNRKRKKRSNSTAYVDVDGNNMVILSHPIYRIFYVSHDSQDVKIFSYIARETSSNVFHCCVFKAANKNQAMRIVRTVGQAFEVCHKLVGVAGEDDELEETQGSATNTNDSSQQLESKTTESKASKDAGVNSGSSNPLPPPVPVVQEAVASGSSTSLLAENNKVHSSSSNVSTPPAAAVCGSLEAVAPVPERQASTSSIGKGNKPQNLDLTKRDATLVASPGDLMNLNTPTSSAVPTPTLAHSFFKEINTLSSKLGGIVSGAKSESNKENLSQVHEAQLLKEQLEQQTQNTRAALAQIQLLRDQLAAESAARIEAQARTHQLLIHNKELLDHLQTLVRHIQELEAVTGTTAKDRASSNSIAAATAAGVTLPQLTPRSKIERWFSFVVPPTTSAAAGGTSDVDDLYSAAEFESLDKALRNLRLSRRTLLSNKESGFVSETNELNDNVSAKKPARVRGGKRNKHADADGATNNYVSSRVIVRNPHARHHVSSAANAAPPRVGRRRLSSTSSWLRRVLRLKRSSAGYSRTKGDMDFYNHDAQSTSTTRKRNSPSLHRVNSSKSRVSSL